MDSGKLSQTGECVPGANNEANVKRSRDPTMMAPDIPHHVLYLKTLHTCV